MPSGFGRMRMIFPLKLVRIARRFLRIPRLAARTLVERRERCRITEGMRVVAGRKIEAAVRAKFDRARVMAAFAPLLLKFQQQLLARGIELLAHHREAAQILPRVAGRRIETVDPSILCKLRIERETQEAIFLVRPDIERHPLPRSAFVSG